MRGGQAARLETKTRQQGVRLDDLLHRRRHLMIQHGVDRGKCVLPQHIPAELGQRGTGQRRQPAGHRLRVRPSGRPGLQPGRQGVTDPGDQQLHRSVRDDLRVDQHQIRVAREEPVLGELAGLGVDHREGAARRIRRGDGRAVRPADPGQEAGGFDRVDGAPAADCERDVGAGGLDHLDQSIDLLRARNAVELLPANRQPGPGQRRLDVVADEPPDQVVGDDQWCGPDLLEVLPELRDGALALDVTSWADDGPHGCCHDSSWVCPTGLWSRMTADTGR